jgi:hypothetical protein
MKEPRRQNGIETILASFGFDPFCQMQGGKSQEYVNISRLANAAMGKMASNPGAFIRAFAA